MDTTVGYVLLGSSAIPAALGFVLSLEGLKKVNSAAETATQTGKETNKLVQSAQNVVATADGEQAHEVASTTRAALAKTDDLTSAVDGVEESLKALTGPLAPARVFLALTLLLIVASLFPLGVLSVSAGG